MRIAFLDTFSGISGDMTVGALLDAGLPLAAVRDAVAQLKLDAVEVAAERVERGGIAATKFHVRVRGEHPDHPRTREHHRAHRPYREIRELLGTSPLAPAVRAVAAVSAPVDLALGVRFIDDEAPWFYRKHMLDSLREDYAAIARRRPVPTPIAA